MISPPSVRTEPPGRSIELRRTASAICAKDKPSLRSFSSETSIEISYGRTPAICTCEMRGLPRIALDRKSPTLSGGGT